MLYDTPRIKTRGFKFKSRGENWDIILPDSWTSMTLFYSRIAKNWGLVVNKRDGDHYDLYNAQGHQMVVVGTVVIQVMSQNCTKHRTLKCIVAPVWKKKNSSSAGRT